MDKTHSPDEVTQNNINHYLEDDAVEAYSKYNLMPEEKYLIPKYFLKGTTILDLACGAGRTTVRLHEMGYPVKGIDLSEVLLNTARKRFPYMRFEQGSYCDIHETDNSFDNILISFNSIDYAHPETEREKALAECSRVIKKGGYLIYSTHNIKYLYGFLLPWNENKLFMLKNVFNGFSSHKYLYEFHKGLWTYYAASEYVKEQTEKYGFRFQEIIGKGFNKIRKVIKDEQSQEKAYRYVSPWLTYVFRKD